MHKIVFYNVVYVDFFCYLLFFSRKKLASISYSLIREKIKCMYVSTIRMRNFMADDFIQKGKSLPLFSLI